jgi:hypothetical protein
MMLLLISESISGCATSGNCAGWQQINPSRKDALTQGTKRQILSHNEFGEKQGCWK